MQGEANHAACVREGEQAVGLGASAAITPPCCFRIGRAGGGCGLCARPQTWQAPLRKLLAAAALTAGIACGSCQRQSQLFESRGWSCWSCSRGGMAAGGPWSAQTGATGWGRPQECGEGGRRQETWCLALHMVREWKRTSFL